MISHFNNIMINIGKIVRRSNVNGPGQRFTIWLQGCSLRCKGCINSAYWSKEPNCLVKIPDLYEMILNTSNIEGVTYSGGEPFEQAEGLYLLSRLLKEKGLSIMSYSGYTYQEIANSQIKFRRQLLSTLDILVDGRYEHKKYAPLLWRGSSNQKLHFLTSLYRHYEKISDANNLQMEFSIEPQTDKLFITGNFSPGMMNEIKKRLIRYGISI